MKSFEVRLRFSDENLTAAILEAMISMKASQAAMNALLIEDIARRSDQDINNLGELYNRLYEDFRLRYLADLEMGYSDTTLAKD